MHCYLQLKLFGKQQRIVLFLDAECRNDVTSHNKAVKKNRLILRQFIDAVCYLPDQGLRFWGHDESYTSLIKGNCMEFLNGLKNL